MRISSKSNFYIIFLIFPVLARSLDGQCNLFACLVILQLFLQGTHAVDLSKEEVTGKELEKRLDDAHITCNKNTIPNEPRSPFVTSGIRLGTPAVTTRGMTEEDMDVIAECIFLVLKSEEDIGKARRMVAGLTEKYPLC